MQTSKTINIPASEHVRELTDEDVETFARENKIAVVEVYTQWCSFCRAFAPHYETVADELSGTIAFGRIDADFNPEYIEENGVQAFPTLLLYKDGQLAGTTIGFTTPPKLREILRELSA